MKRLKTFQLYLMILTMVMMFASTTSFASEQIDTSLADDIVIILDVSGSMQKTDAERLSFESIEMFMNICDENDRIGVVAFNENIVFQSDLIAIKDEEAIRDMKKRLATVTYQGDTDNGLGLKAGISLLTAQDNTTRNQAIIFISDGKTDLPDQKTGRTVEDSYADLESSKNIAEAQGIAIYTIGFSTSDSDIADELMTMSAATKGTSNICTGPLQMLNTVMDIAMLYKDTYQSEQNTVKLGDKLQTFDLPVQANSTVYIIFEASKPLSDFKIVSQQQQIKMYETTHCRIIRCNNTTQEQMSICFRSETDGNAIIRNIQIQQEETTPQIDASTPAIAGQTFGGSGTVHAVAGVSAEQEGDTSFYLAILILAVFTITISGVIIYGFFHVKKPKKQMAVLKGYLHACFIDLKSKNDIPDMYWNLSDYPEEGVSLKELFESSGIHEDLPQLNQICLYPNEEGEGLLLVHCTEGGIFINDRTVSSNVPAQVRFGETIYVAFPENASEFSLQYYDKKEVS